MPDRWWQNDTGETLSIAGRSIRCCNGEINSCMRTFSLLLLAIFSFSGLSAQAEAPYQVDLVSTGRAYLWVDKSWNSSAECIEVKVSTTVNEPARDIALKAYFYDADGKILHSEDKPSLVADNNGGTIPPVVAYAKGKRYPFFFGIPSAIQAGNSKWKRVVVVFGKGADVSAKVYPKDDLAKFSFPEKANVKE